MKHLLRFALPCLFLLGACNKDEEIIIDVPEGPETPLFTVIEYLPGPGQFINDPSAGFAGINSMNRACEYAMKRLEDNLFVSLGAWGGYITVKVSQSIFNSGGYDFSIYGNAFDTSNEPGIVWVMADTNGNGLPDDEWYELKGSYYGREGYRKDYWVTYYRPDAKSGVRFSNCDGETGTVDWNGKFHSQDYYFPLWVEGDSYTLKGSMLPDRKYRDAVGQWVNPPFEWGYADNMGSDSKIVVMGGKKLQQNSFKISDAVDATGAPVNLEFIDFIKVQTAVCGQSDVLGENSTEVCGFSLYD